MLSSFADVTCVRLAGRTAFTTRIEREQVLRRVIEFLDINNNKYRFIIELVTFESDFVIEQNSFIEGECLRLRLRRSHC